MNAPNRPPTRPRRTPPRFENTNHPTTPPMTRLVKVQLMTMMTSDRGGEGRCAGGIAGRGRMKSEGNVMNATKNDPIPRLSRHVVDARLPTHNPETSPVRGRFSGMGTDSSSYSNSVNRRSPSMAFDGQTQASMAGYELAAGSSQRGGQGFESPQLHPRSDTVPGALDALSTGQYRSNAQQRVAPASRPMRPRRPPRRRSEVGQRRRHLWRRLVQEALHEVERMVELHVVARDPVLR
jgi:hypothetical protein